MLGGTAHARITLLMDLLPIAFSALTGLATLVGSIYVARRYQKLGGGVAQERFNSIQKELNAALEARVGILTTDLLSKTSEALSLNARIGELQAELNEERRARLKSQQDIDDLRDQIRTLRREAKQDREEMRNGNGNGNGTP